MTNKSTRLFLLKIWATHILLIVIGYYCIDKPLAEWLYFNHIGDILMPYLGRIVEIPAILTRIAPLVAAVFMLKYFLISKFKKFESSILFISITLTVTYQIKDILKWVFGRTWPLTWKNNNPSWINDHVYGFHWFSGNKFTLNDALASFPSGHTTGIFTIMCLLSLLYPRRRKLFLSLAYIEGICMVLFNYHFFSDVIAGMLLGWTSALVTMHFYQSRWKS